jgi:hypothetical protein
MRTTYPQHWMVVEHVLNPILTYVVSGEVVCAGGEFGYEETRERLFRAWEGGFSVYGLELLFDG